MSGSRAVGNLAAAAVCLLPLLVACGSGSDSAGNSGSGAKGSGQLTVPVDASESLKKSYVMENAIAFCMKKAGFAYIPEAPDDPAKSWATDGGDYGLTKKFREKYGFGVYSGVVYPNDPQAPGSKVADKPSANAQYVDTLTPAQKTSYHKALGGPPDGKTDKDWSGCMKTAHTEAYGSRSVQEESAATQQEMQQNAQALNGDPHLVQLAQSYASCLRQDGIEVSTTQPTSIGDMVKLQAHASAPANVNGGAVATSRTDIKQAAPMSRSEALPLLKKDIDLSLQDLECGKEFRAAYFPMFLKAPTNGGGAG